MTKHRLVKSHAVKSVKSNEEWRKQLTPEQYHVMREKGTEPPFSGKYVHNEEQGTYRCGACGQELFVSAAKYDSGSGWPSFFRPIAQERLVEAEDHSHGMERTELRCAQCGAHLGHVFDDGPPPTGRRYCVNSLSLEFQPEEPAAR